MVSCLIQEAIRWKLQVPGRLFEPGFKRYSFRGISNDLSPKIQYRVVKGELVAFMN